MSYKSELGRVRGLGSAKHGAHHWIVQRGTAIANIFLLVWLVVSLFMLPNFGYEAVAAWLSRPLVAVPMLLLLLNVFWHIRLGWLVLIEDYIHDHGLKVIALIALNFYTFGLTALSVFAVAKLAFTGVPA